MERSTRQREAIRHNLSGRKDHPTAETLFEDLKGEIPNMSLATVYRNLSQMAKSGEIRRIALEEDPSARFDYDTSGHSHFFCRRCKSLTDVPEVRALDGRAEVEDLLGGSVEKVSVMYSGLCAACREAGDTPEDVPERA